MVLTIEQMWIKIWALGQTLNCWIPWEREKEFCLIALMCRRARGEKERDGVWGEKVFAENLSPSLLFSLSTGRHQTNTPAPQTNPLSTAPTFPASAVHSHAPIPHYTQTHTKHINAHTLTHAHTRSHSSLHTARAEQWEIVESEQERCFGVMGGNVGVSSGIDEVLFQRLSPEQGRCALAV